MRTLAKTLFLSVLILISAGSINAQVENILKNSVPELYGALKITPDRKYDVSEKKDYRDLYYKLNSAIDDIKAYRMEALTDETVQVFDYKEIKKLGKDVTKMDSLEQLVLAHMVSINDYMKWDERLAADSLGAPMAYTSFQDLYKAKKYEEAYNAWRLLFNKYPVISKTIYSGGAKLVDYKIKKAADENERQKYIDTLFLVYDQQVKVYPERDVYILGRKTVDYYNFFIKKQDLNDSIIRIKLGINYEMANKAIEKGKEKTAYYVFPIAMKLSLFQYLLGSITAETALDNYLYYSDILNEQYEAEKDEDKREKIKTRGIDPVENVFIKSEDLSTCEHLIPIFTKKFEEAPNDADNLKKIITILGRKGCVDSSLYSEVVIALYELEPSAEYANNLGMLFYSQGKDEKALKYFNEAIDKETVDSLKAKYYFSAATILKKENKYSDARNYCRKSLEFNPNNGKAYILIATMYASTAGSVGADGFAHQAVYWAAVDKLIQAKNADPSVADDANSLISTYSAHYPKREEGFMQGFPEGTSYTVGGWIGEVTTARYIK